MTAATDVSERAQPPADAMQPAKVAAEAEASRVASQAEPAEREQPKVVPSHQAEPAAPTEQLPAPPAPAPNGTAAAADPCRQVAASAAGTISIRFGYASASLDQPSVDALHRLATSFRACPAVRMTIAGHTDSDGHVDRNQALSVRRAEAVRQLLVDAGAAPAQLSVIGYGQARPLAPNDTATNKHRNRRIELVVE